MPTAASLYLAISSNFFAKIAVEVRKNFEEDLRCPLFSSICTVTLAQFLLQIYRGAIEYNLPLALILLTQQIHSIVSGGFHPQFGYFVAKHEECHVFIKRRCHLNRKKNVPNDEA